MWKCVIPIIICALVCGVEGAWTADFINGPTDFVEEIEKMLDDLIHKDDSDPYVPVPYPITNWCSAWLYKFAHVASNFIQCSVRHARPFRFCRNCFDEYITAHNFISELIAEDEKLTTNRRCFAKLINSDIINIVGKVRDFMEHVWSDSYCTSCFEHYQFDNGTLIGELTNMTRDYMNQYNITYTCISSYIYFDNTTKKYDQFACVQCESNYRKLNNMYMNMKSNGSVCMDVTDAMNYTRYLWSKDFQCNIQDPNEAVIYGTCLSIFTLPIFFYVISRFQGKIHKRRLMKLKRLNLKKGPAHANLLRSASLVYSDQVHHINRRGSVVDEVNARLLNISPTAELADDTH